MMRCSFEETVEILMEAAAFSTCDNLQGVSENVMMGQLCPLGTGTFDLVLNEEMLKDAVDTFGEGDDDLHMDSPGGDGGASPEGGKTPAPEVDFLGGGMSPGGGGFSPDQAGSFSPEQGGFSPGAWPETPIRGTTRCDHPLTGVPHLRLGPRRPGHVALWRRPWRRRRRGC